MLVLSRKLSESIVIGDGVNSPRIVVTVVDIEKGRVRLGVEAPRDVVILRKELLGDGERAARGGE